MIKNYYKENQFSQYCIMIDLMVNYEDVDRFNFPLCC